MAMVRIYAGPFAFVGPTGRPARCWLEVYTGPGRLPLAVVVEDPDNPGVSITNGIEELATAIWREVLPAAADGFTLAEGYLDPAQKTPALRERWSLAELRPERGRLINPRWRHTTRAAIEEIAGDAIRPPFASSYSVPGRVEA